MRSNWPKTSIRTAPRLSRNISGLTGPPGSSST
jgi:hypothetical protein